MVDDKPSFRFSKIMVPLDGSLCAEKALEPALAIAGSMRAELVLFRVAQPIPRTRALADMPDVYLEVVAAAYREAEIYLEELMGRLSYDKITIEHEPVETGVARQILDYCTAQGVDLIVFSSHGYSGVKRWTRGAIADKLLNGAICATLMVRCLDEAQEEHNRQA